MSYLDAVNITRQERIYCRKWSAKEIDKSGLVKIRVKFERYF